MSLTFRLAVNTVIFLIALFPGMSNAAIVAQQLDASVADTMIPFYGMVVQPHVLTTGSTPLDIYQLGIYTYSYNLSNYWHTSFTGLGCGFIAGDEDAYIGFIEDGPDVYHIPHFSATGNLICDYDATTHFFRIYSSDSSSPIITLKPNTTYNLFGMRSELDASARIYGSHTAGSGACYQDSSWPYNTSGVSGCNAGPSPQLSSIAYFIASDPDSRPTVSPPACTPGIDPDCNDNVLFLPGMEASRLYRPSRFDEPGTEHLLWEPSSDQDASYLSLDASGKQPDLWSPQSNIYTRDVLDEAYVGTAGPNIYKTFITKLDDLKAVGKIADWVKIPYDWRLSLDDIVENGTKDGQNVSYLSTSSNPYLVSEFLRLASTSRTGKVTIVAHSNGGLVTKALLIRHPELNQYVDRIIFVDVPQIGTPQAIAALLHGSGQAIPTKLSARAARSFAQNAPVVYNLLPSFQYFSSVSDPVITFDGSTLPEWQSRYGASIGLSGQLKNYLTDGYLRVAGDSSNIIYPTQANTGLLNQAEAIHASLDAWIPPTDIQLIQIAGWGIPTTVKGLEYSSTTQSTFCNSATPIPGQNSVCEHGFTMTASTTIDGDGTVVVPSALWTSAALPNVKNYWVDLRQYNRTHFTSTLFGNNGFLAISHKNVLEVDGLYKLIADTIARSVKPLRDYTYLRDSLSEIEKGDIRLRYTLHSPLTLDMYDSQGNHTGISTTTGQLEEQIPGTYYMELAGVKYLFTDASSSSHIVMRGYDNGTFTFTVNQYQGDTPTISTIFKDIPTTASTTATLDIQSDITTLSSLHLDETGTGHTIDLAPILDGTVTLDAIPPTTTLALDGTPGLNGWYTSNVTATLTATDTQSGVQGTTLVLDGATTTASTTPFTKTISAEGSHSLTYNSIDNAGNQETPTTTIIKIDKTSPETQISFSTSTKSIQVRGSDNLSTTTIATSSTMTTMSDQAGNTLKLGTQVIPKPNSTVLAIPSLSYSTGSTTNATTTLRYFWTTDKTGKYTLLISAIKTPTERTLAIYTSLTNQTYFVATTPADDAQDLSLQSALLLLRLKLKTYQGMYIPSVVTSKGNIIIR